MLIIDGKSTAAGIRAELKSHIDAVMVSGKRQPGLAVILVGEDPASQVYVRNKEKACAEVGICSIPLRLPANIAQQALLDHIAALNTDSAVDGILLQLPLPKHIDTHACLCALSPAKDVDGFHPENVGRLSLGLPGFVPCTPAGVMELLKRYALRTSGKEVVVVGRSNIVGKPLAMLLARPGVDATVTVCHSRTTDLTACCRRADMLFLALGMPRFVIGDMVKPGAVVIDVGINRSKTDGGLCGDADYASVSQKASAITPVPGGVGPMTIAMLLKNTVKAWQLRVK